MADYSNPSWTKSHDLIRHLNAKGHNVAMRCEGCYLYLENASSDYKYFIATGVDDFFAKLSDFDKEAK